MADAERVLRLDPLNSGPGARDKIEWVKKNL
jgi:hypothetical protein